LEIKGETFTIFGAHFKSMSDGDTERRIDEARRAATIVRDVASEFSSHLIVLAGDLNGLSESEELEILFDDADLNWTGRDLGVRRGWTYRYRGRKQVLDYILWRGGEGQHYLEGSTQIFRDETRAGYAGSDHAAVRSTFRY
jgi:predicted extracellular nuclease